MSISSTVHARVAAHPRAAVRSPMGLSMISVILLAMVVAMFFLMG